VLQNEPEWTEERIRDAMAKGKSNIAPLAEPVPVVIAYLTSIAKKDGQVYFFPDIYDHDRLLDNALRRRSQVLEILRTREGDAD
jgi:murein L,D-transpeptidase YcbB/YkuD